MRSGRSQIRGMRITLRELMLLLKPLTIFTSLLYLAVLPTTAQVLKTINPSSASSLNTPRETSPPDSEPGLPYKYVGNSFSLKFHRPSCPFAKAMSLRHVQLHHFRKQAIQAGQKPCKYCLPHDWKEVHASLAPANSQRRCPPPRLTYTPTPFH